MALENKNTKTEFVNREIRARQILVINDDGTKVGPLNKFEAIKMAEDEGLDLFQVGMQDKNTAIAKILDYGKFKYEQKRKLRENKKIKLRLKTKKLD
ncbi:translation initiation factor IF-3 [Spiroplasma clarkii]|uniref:translation initiation factor IF-3 n=1 Tax=Spiroplasma clarkii TaxID=2139 RepID=UPI000B572510|nr:translation initiation factor IF-3 [Spiroplasma clarkii]ARU92092.1 translation initiation factor IF-3 [Spiroplasma clarkii]